ncbi:hypothetical protein NDU88_009268 [Pleurodeles waltl]|uniref:Uncharacterized protein n=1 Tax=Pleurodeles waltl TaxID=8319 RepID=A0AAV7QR26_PLEWA|nr:hypothetical protein NDU88_009268 [Pleurodeles waltl]
MGGLKRWRMRRVAIVKARRGWRAAGPQGITRVLGEEVAPPGAEPYCDSGRPRQKTWAGAAGRVVCLD